MTPNQQKFIQAQIWSNTIQASFQRANIYIKTAKDIERTEFKKGLYDKLKTIAEQYNSLASEDDHIANILDLQQFTAGNRILQNTQLSFGVCQKMLNLYLKYQWCLGLIPPPPHFPVDAIIQEKLIYPEPKAWTSKDFSEPDYRNIINHAKAVLETETENQVSNLAELELYLYNNK